MTIDLQNRQNLSSPSRILRASATRIACLTLFTSILQVRQAASRGFTLIEILVVLVIVGVMLALVSLNLAPDDGRILQTEGQRLALLLEQARDEAISSGQEIAWSSAKESYRFWRKDKKDEWVASSEDELFRERNWPPGVQVLEIRINRNPAPSNQRLVFSPAGLNTPFQLALGLGEQRIWVKGGGMGGMTVEKRQE